MLLRALDKLREVRDFPENLVEQEDQLRGDKSLNDFTED